MRYFADSVYDRRVRMDQMMNRSYLRTNRDDLTRSLNWAKVSLDALSLSTPPGGVWSGVPFGDIVGARDIFSSVPGIVLGTGKLKDLVPVFREFAATQDTDPASGSYGCIADRLGDSREYTDADATPLFVAALGMYVQYSGDSLFAAEMLPYVRRSIEGALRYRTDSLLFLKHGDDGTWMGIPRGNRADDLQGYWQKQLQTGISLCDDLRIDSLQQEAGRWRDAAATLEANFRKYFIDSTGVSIADYLSPTGKRDQVVRPNQLMDAGILNNSLLYQSIFAKLTPMLVSPYGVLTRSVLDPGFHTFHYDRQLYAPQQGVYEGVIHTWLAGEWTTQAVKFGLPDSAMIVTRNMSNTILHGAIPGTLPEMIDAARLDGDSLVRASGYMSSARGLAEYLRSWYEGYLGVSVDHMGSHLTLYPNLPASVTDVDFNVPVGGSSVAVQYRKLNDQLTVGLSSPPGTPVLGVVLLAPVTKNATPLRRAEFDLNADKPLKLAITKEGINRIGPGQQERVKVSEVTTGFDRRVLKNVHLASVTGSNIQNQAGAGISLLTLHDVKHPPQAASVLADIADSSFNDSLLGIGGEGWLGDLKRGILDITHFTVRVDSAYMYFTITYRDLCYPTTHPEYGFDRTITAVAIDRNGEVSDGSSTVGRNAHCTFSNFSFSEIIYLGSGLRIEDGRGNVLAEYYPVPDDDHQPLGDYIDKSVSFSIPVQITGKPSVNWRYAVVTGVRDDGGGDIGTFRTVSREMASGTHQKQEMMKGNIFDLVRVPSGK